MYALAEKTATEALKAYSSFLIQEAYGELAFSRSRVCELFKQYKYNWESIEDDCRKFPKVTVRTAENINTVSKVITSARRMTIQKIADVIGLSYGTIKTILHNNLNLSKLSARWVPRLLSDEHKKKHLKMARDFTKHHFHKGKAFLDSIVAMDETWVLFTTPEIKLQSEQCLEMGGKPPKKVKIVGSQKKVMLITFFDAKGMIYQHYVPNSTTINFVYYCDVLATFLKHLGGKRLEKICDGWLLHQDNARPHVSQFMLDFMAKKRINSFTHTPYSPDLTQCDFWLFPNLKTELAGMKFITLKNVQTAVQGVLAELFKDSTMHVMEAWAKRLTKCIELGGDYVDK